MEIAFVLLVAAATFGVCFLVDKGFTKLFRSQSQHYSGLSVRLNRKYGAIGLILCVIGIGAIFTGLSATWVLIAGGAIVTLMGAALVVYYMTFGIFYDKESFVYTSFGKKSVTYRYAEIKAQQLYNASGAIVIELHLTDGRAVQLHASMEGAYAFMDKAFFRWLEQTGRVQEDCAFFDPQNSCWFPPVEG